MRPDSIYKCIKGYSGTTAQGKKLNISEGSLFFKSTGDTFVYLNDYDQPSKQLPWLTLEEFSALEGEYLERSAAT